MSKVSQTAYARRAVIALTSTGLLVTGGLLAAPPASAAPAVTQAAAKPILRPGMTHPLVRTVQRKLGVRVTGYFGPLTTNAVRSFQGARGIPTTGNVGPLTWAALARLGSKPQPPASQAKPAAAWPLRMGMTSPTIRTLQVRLKMPVVTGYFGTLTRSYVEAFQRSAGLQVTGIVNRRVFSKVGSVSFTPPGSAQPSTPPTVVDKGSLAGRVLDVAASLRGIPYVATGYSPSTGFNCSSFTQYVYQRVGVNLGGAYTVTQYANAKKITASQARPGDLVFFYNYPNNFLGHVGIYAGNGKFWHAPRTGRVVSLDPIYSSKVLFARVL